MSRPPFPFHLILERIFLWFHTLVPPTSSCKAHCRCKVGYTMANASRSTHPGGWVGQQTHELGSDIKPFTHALL